MTLAENAAGDLGASLGRIRERAAAAALATGRQPDQVQVLLATKTQRPERIIQAFAAGFRLIGENRVQELVDKAPSLAGYEHRIHFIGHLQSNKVNSVLRYVSCVQSVDSIELARRLDSRAAGGDQPLDVFVQVNVSGEDSKSGVAPDRAVELAGQVDQLAALRLRGLMTVGLNSADAGAVRAGYQQLAELREVLALPAARELSMGMSSDFELAIAAGATMVRVGSAVFGARPLATG